MPTQEKWAQIRKYIKDAYSISSLEMLIPGTTGYKLKHMPCFTLQSVSELKPDAAEIPDEYEYMPLYKMATPKEEKEKLPFDATALPQFKLASQDKETLPKTPKKKETVQPQDDVRMYSISDVRYSLNDQDYSAAEHEIQPAACKSDIEEPLHELLSEYLVNSKGTPEAGKLVRNISRSVKLDISFFECVEEWLKKKKINHVDFYNYSNISRQTYYRMKTQLGKPPTKAIALACVVGLELTIDEANELLKKAGLSLSNSNITDVVVQAFLSAGEYDIDLINETILYFDGTPIGSAERT